MFPLPARVSEAETMGRVISAMYFQACLIKFHNYHKVLSYSLPFVLWLVLDIVERNIKVLNMELYLLIVHSSRNDSEFPGMASILSGKSLSMDPMQQDSIDNIIVQELKGTVNEWGWCKQKAPLPADQVKPLTEFDYGGGYAALTSRHLLVLAQLIMVLLSCSVAQFRFGGTVCCYLVLAQAWSCSVGFGAGVAELRCVGSWQ
ncbi:phosphopyruvate hydratase [Sarracenia purpurea var. burkii]